ncbi:uncharacterized protein N7496_010049 [Penicillium cataractarum]|uniref:DUF7702 domain-containing protein n=1 Tax=Penicillium cataractarum TaxID=2100454 RepID=A0A9W9RQ42_9EURO|nr:uncharacterized protein N7496_010049 [Penicillium cataractarum]KAJ5364336.1 hypothetical protein N7496_010049 [Penicillium cataractarum]
MFNDHSKVSIAQIVFYFPAILISIYLACYRHNRPRMSWIILLFFSLSTHHLQQSIHISIKKISNTFFSVRLTAGILVVIYEHKPSTGIMVASIILLNAGVFPLVAATMGLIRIIVSCEDNMNPRISRCLLFSRMLFFVGLGLQIAGGCLEGSDSSSDVDIGVKLVKAGYSCVVVFVACLLGVQVYFWMHLSSLSAGSKTILQAMMIALPFIVVRITYLFLSVVDPSDLRWNDLTGPIAPYLLMGLIMEYAVVCIYLATGFIIPQQRKNNKKPQGLGYSSVEEL